MKNVLKEFGITLAALCVLAACEQLGGVVDDGSQGYIEIKSAADLAKIGADYPLNGEYRIPAGNREIKLSGWAPIGTQDAPFTGKFNGNGGGITIEGFAAEALSGNYLGLFAVIRDAEIQNLTVTVSTGGEIILDGDDDKYAAALAAYVSGGKLKNVSAAGTLRVNKTGAKALYTGGLAAYAGNVTIEASASGLTITAEGDRNVYSGGLAAYVTGSTRITGSSALGDVSVTGGSSHAAYTGGLVGYTDGESGSLTMSAVNYTSGTVSANAYSVYSGGIAGYAKGAVISESYASGMVIAEGSTPFAGGIAASLVGGTVKDAYTMTDVTSKSATKRALAGGIAGGVSVGGEVLASYTTGNVTAEITGSLSGPTHPAPEGAQAGGVAGVLYGESPAVKISAVLEGGSVTARDTASGGSLRAYRIAFKAEGSEAELSDNIAYADLPLTGRTADDKGADGQDGEDTDQEKPAKAVYEGLGWDFDNVWRMSAAGYPALTGQEVNLGDYIEITVGGQLAQIGVSNAYPLNAAYRIPAGTADITLSDWMPIGTAEKPFTGSLTGNGSTVIRINGFAAAVSGADSAGLFGYVKGSLRQKAAFKSVKAEVTMTGTANLTLNKAQYAGGLAAYGEELTIDGCSVSGTLKWNKTTSYPLYSGGLVGYLKNGKITESASAAAVESEGQVGVFGGGILGYGSGSLMISACAHTGNITVKAGTHNSSAGGIVGYILGTNDSTVSGCTAQGDISLTPATGREETQLMFYCGGVVGYAGNGTADMGEVERTGALVEKSRYLGGTVYCENAYPYAGGVIGYNYTGSEVRESYSAASATVVAKGSRLPYAGGVAGYISGAAKVIDSYSRAAVTAETPESKQALAGGVAGATAKPSLLSKCYSTGAVTAKINGSGTSDMGGSLGVPSAANAGGISGSIYYANPKVEKSVALNVLVSGVDTGSGGTLKVYRIGGLSSLDGGGPTLDDNMAWSGMPVTGGAVSEKGLDKQDGADCAAKPVQSVYVGLGWDFSTVWRMGTDGYPALRWE